MREIHPLVTDIDRYLEEALRAKQQLDAQRWRDERLRAMRAFAARATTLRWSRALLKLVVQEVYPDDRFTEWSGDFDRIPPREWLGAIAVGIALSRSWRRDGLARVARPGTAAHRTRRHPYQPHPPTHPTITNAFSGSPRAGQGSSLRSDPARRGSRP